MPTLTRASSTWAAVSAGMPLQREVDSIHHPFEPEPFLNCTPPLASDAFKQLRGFQQSRNLSCASRDVFFRKDQRIHFVFENLGAAARAGRHHRQAATHRLKQRDAERLIPDRWEQEHIVLAIDGWQLLAR